MYLINSYDGLLASVLWLRQGLGWEFGCFSTFTSLRKAFWSVNFLSLRAFVISFGFSQATVIGGRLRSEGNYSRTFLLLS